jgi:hypothetical protein
MTYKKINFSDGRYCIKRLEDCAYIPVDEANKDYQEYLKWVAEGNIAEEITNGN